MDRREVVEGAKNVMCRIFKVQPDAIAETTRAADINGWDSLTHLVLITGLEKKFDVELPMTEAHAAQNVGELINLVYNTITCDTGDRS